jgi:hypothetical protein
MNEVWTVSKQVVDSVDAILSMDIQYVKKGNVVTVSKGTQIKVDLRRGYALVGKDHVTIGEHEYNLLDC